MTTPLEDLAEAVAEVTAEVFDLQSQVVTLNSQLDGATDQLIADQALIGDLKAQLAAIPKPRTLLFGHSVGGLEPGLEAFEAKLVVPRARVTRWFGVLGGSDLSSVHAMEDAGRTVIISFVSKQNDATTWTWASVANGDHDAAIDKLTVALNGLKRQHYLCFNHEPEFRMAHSTEQYGDFLAACDHVFTRWRATNHLLTPIFQPTQPGPLPQIYDRVGFDPYNWAFTSHNGTWTWPETLLNRAIASCTDTTVPIIIPETGCSVDPTNFFRKANWLSRLYLAARANPRIEAVSYFSRDHRTATSGEKENAWWSLDSDAESQAAWQSVLKAAA